MSNKKIIQAIGFIIDPSGQMARCLRYNAGGVRPATNEEKALWDALHDTVVGDGQAGDTTPVSTELVNFLRGSGQLEGLQYGDKLEGHAAGDLFWRDLLPAVEAVETDINTDINQSINSEAPMEKNVTATEKNPGDLKVLTTAPTGDTNNQPALGSLQPADVVDAAASGNLEQLLADKERAAEQADQDGTGELGEGGVVTEAPTGDVDHKPALGSVQGDGDDAAGQKADTTAKSTKPAAKATSAKKS